MNSTLPLRVKKLGSSQEFAKMSPDFAIDAAYARKEFGPGNKPSLVDYLLWMAEFVTKSDMVEW